MNHMDHLEINNQVTLKTLDINRTEKNIESTMERFEDVYKICEPYLSKDQQILDLGTKDCLLFDLLTEKYNFNKENLRGFDCCDEVVTICQEKGYQVFPADIQELPEHGVYYDFIFIIHTLEHVPNPEEVVSECTRVLKPNGFVFVEVPILTEYEPPELWGHYHLFQSQKEVRDLWLENGYKAVVHDWQERIPTGRKTVPKRPWYRILFQKES